MPVDSLHGDYVRFADAWRDIRDAVAGARAVKSAGERYLPRLSEQSEDEYSAYRMRAQFFGATGKTLEVMLGSVFRKNPNFNQSGLDDFLEDATLSGASFYDYCKQTAGEVFSVGRFGTLVDWEPDEGRPIVSGYATENIINWRTARIEGRETLVLLVLHEMSGDTIDLGDSAERAQDDGFVQNLVDQWRVFRLVQGTPDDDSGQTTHFVRCEVYRRPKSKKNAATKRDLPGTGAASDDGFIKVDETIPTRRGIPLARIPFVFHGPENNTAAVERPPLEALADLNFSHYRTSADLEHGRHFTGLPQPWAAGFDLQSAKIGSSVAWVTETTGATVGYLEFTGQGLGALSTALEEKEKQMTALGARMLMPTMKDAEAFDTVRLKQSAETSALMSSAIALGQSMTGVLRWVAWWNGTAATPEDEVKTSVEINTEFVASTLRPEEITALVAAWQADAISWETLMFNLRRGELYPDDFDPEDERERIQKAVELTMRTQAELMRPQPNGGPPKPNNPNDRPAGSRQ